MRTSDFAILDLCRKQHYSRAYQTYWLRHTSCECGCGEGSIGPHHIRSRGAHGEIDEEWNLLALSAKCHREIHQNPGRFFERMEETHPEIAGKIVLARNRPLPAYNKGPNRAERSEKEEST